MLQEIERNTVTLMMLVAVDARPDKFQMPGKIVIQPAFTHVLQRQFPGDQSKFLDQEIISDLNDQDQIVQRIEEDHAQDKAYSCKKIQLCRSFEPAASMKMILNRSLYIHITRPDSPFESPKCPF
jgi:hypothetical protein